MRIGLLKKRGVGVRVGLIWDFDLGGEGRGEGMEVGRGWDGVG